MSLRYVSIQEDAIISMYPNVTSMLKRQTNHYAFLEIGNYRQPMNSVMSVSKQNRFLAFLFFKKECVQVSVFVNSNNFVNSFLIFFSEKKLLSKRVATLNEYLFVYNLCTAILEERGYPERHGYLEA